MCKVLCSPAASSQMTSNPLSDLKHRSLHWHSEDRLHRYACLHLRPDRACNVKSIGTCHITFRTNIQRLPLPFLHLHEPREVGRFAGLSYGIMLSERSGLGYGGVAGTLQVGRCVSRDANKLGGKRLLKAC